MKVIEPYVEIDADELDRKKLSKLERAARTCYKTEFKDDPEFLRRIIGRGHESVIEHEKITIRIICDRGITHEIVRHRLGAYSQESTRYCNYSKDRFGSEITVIRPFSLPVGSDAYRLWENECRASEDAYMLLLAGGITPETARDVLLTALKTEIVVTYNLREWRHFLKLRADKAAHPQIRQLAIPILLKFKEAYPEIFGDIPYDESLLPDDYAEVRILG